MKKSKVLSGISQILDLGFQKNILSKIFNVHKYNKYNIMNIILTDFAA